MDFTSAWIDLNYRFENIAKSKRIYMKKETITCVLYVENTIFRNIWLPLGGDFGIQNYWTFDHLDILTVSERCVDKQVANIYQQPNERFARFCFQGYIRESADHSHFVPWSQSDQHTTRQGVHVPELVAKARAEPQQDPYHQPRELHRAAQPAASRFAQQRLNDNRRQNLRANNGPAGARARRQSHPDHQRWCV